MLKLCLIALIVLPAALAIYNPYEFHAPLGGNKNTWRLVFRGTAGIGESVYKAYAEGYKKNVQRGCKTINWKAPCNSHYRNDDALENWWNVRDVLFGIVKDGVLVKTLKFKGKGTNYMDWFSQKNFRDYDNCWHDIARYKKNLFFSIAGHAKIHRRFFIQHKYGGCPNDVGWFAAIDTVNSKRPCPWEKGGRFPVFKFAAGPSRVNWMGPSVQNADAIAIFVRYNHFGGDVSEYHDLFKTGKRDWRMAFRGTAGVGAPIFEAYRFGKGIPAKVNPWCRSSDWSSASSCDSHYRNEAVFKNWGNVEKVLFGVVDNGALVKYMIFNGKNTNLLTWFKLGKLVDACWSDIQTNILKNYLNVIGNGERHFFVNHKYGGCPNDIGWIVAVDNANGNRPCSWEKSSKTPKLMYSAGMTRANWNNQKNGEVKEAEAFVIFVQMKK